MLTNMLMNKRTNEPTNTTDRDLFLPKVTNIELTNNFEGKGKGKAGGKCNLVLDMGVWS